MIFFNFQIIFETFLGRDLASLNRLDLGRKYEHVSNREQQNYDAASDKSGSLSPEEAATTLDAEVLDSGTVQGGARRPRPAIVGWGPDLGPPTVTLVVRHGVTAHSLERKFSGSGTTFDPPLVAEGIAQAELAAAELERRGGGDVLVCSPMLRTRQTAEILGAAIGLVPVVVEGLQEGDFGDWDGFTFGEVMACGRRRCRPGCPRRMSRRREASRCVRSRHACRVPSTRCSPRTPVAKSSWPRTSGRSGR